MATKTESNAFVRGLISVFGVGQASYHRNRREAILSDASRGVEIAWSDAGRYLKGAMENEPVGRRGTRRASKGVR
jgi:hypothetical protein